MPFVSKAQQRFFFAAANKNTKWRRLKGRKRPNITKAIAKRWAKETPNIKALPYHARHKARMKYLTKR